MSSDESAAEGQAGGERTLSVDKAAKLLLVHPKTLQKLALLAGVNYLVRPATTILAGGGGERFR